MKNANRNNKMKHGHKIIKSIRKIKHKNINKTLSKQINKTATQKCISLRKMWERGTGQFIAWLD